MGEEDKSDMVLIFWLLKHVSRREATVNKKLIYNFHFKNSREWQRVYSVEEITSQENHLRVSQGLASHLRRLSIL